MVAELEDSHTAYHGGDDMRTLTTFVTGLFVGAAVVAVGAQANRLDGNNGVNHVGIAVERMDDAIAYYTKTFGFNEAAVLRDDNGQPTLAFIQVSRNTFIELAPASDTRPVGLNHFGLQVDDVEAAAAELRRRGVEIGAPRAGRTVSFITSTTDPVGVRIELSELRPDSMLGKAIASWK
jgi:catechol 2,3-dioxygenase-like lactoylglutathione lyase family enzyme